MAMALRALGSKQNYPRTASSGKSIRLSLLCLYCWEHDLCHNFLLNMSLHRSWSDRIWHSRNNRLYERSWLTWSHELHHSDCNLRFHNSLSGVRTQNRERRSICSYWSYSCSFDSLLASLVLQMAKRKRQMTYGCSWSGSWNGSLVWSSCWWSIVRLWNFKKCSFLDNRDIL